MKKYIVKRLLSIVVLAFSISVFVFLIIRLIPGDPVIAMMGSDAGDVALAESIRHELGLDQPLPLQYWNWITGIFRGDFGYSYGQHRSVSSLIAQNLPATLQLAVAGLLISLLLGAALGVVAALRRNTRVDTIGMSAALVLMSIPSFWLGLLILLLFAVVLRWFPVVGGTSLTGLVLPALTLGLAGVGFNARFMRSSVIAAASQKHVLTARAKGITSQQVVSRHIIRNALLSVITVAGLQVGEVLSGVVIVETVFSRPGIGRLLVEGIVAKDYLTVQAVVLLIAIAFAVVNLLVDLLYPVLDPRVVRA